MEPIVKHVHLTLIKKGFTLSIAESCTGGLLSQLITSNSGSSKYFILGVVAYNNKVKESVLSIPSKIIAQQGAVSAKVAAKMAISVRKLAKTDFGIGITGIAGPTGAAPGKPIGTVFIAVSRSCKTICKKFHFRGNRTAIRKKSVNMALELLKEVI